MTSAQHHSDDNNINTDNHEGSWTIFQGVIPSSTARNDDADSEQKAAIQRRSGPLLTLFPEDDNASNRHAKHSVLTPAEQRSYLTTHGKECYPSSDNDDDLLVERYDLFIASPTLINLATELWKYCALYAEGGIYVDAETAPLAALGDVLLNWKYKTDSTAVSTNYVVMSDTQDAGVSPTLLNGDSISDSVTTASSLGTGRPIAISSLLAIASKQHSVPMKMIAKLMETSAEILEEDALLLPKTLMALIQDDEAKEGNKWGLLKQRCNGIEVAGGGSSSSNDEEHRTLRHCPTSKGYCCEILDPQQNFVFLLSRQPLVPNQILPHSSTLPQPYSKYSSSYAITTATATAEKEIPFMSTLRDDTSSPLLSSKSSFTPGSSESTPNMYELLNSFNALPNQESQTCMDCLREKKAADCTLCNEVCPNFCSKICELDMEDKPVKKVLSVVGPKYRKDPERLIPRIVHQVSYTML